MWKAETWVALGTGLAMTAAGLIFQKHAPWLLIGAAICYAVALMSYLRNQRRLAKKKAGEAVPPPAANMGGIIIDGCDFSDNGGAGIKLGRGVRAQITNTQALRNKDGGLVSDDDPTESPV